MCFHFCVLPCFPWLLPVLTIGTCDIAAKRSNVSRTEGHGKAGLIRIGVTQLSAGYGWFADSRYHSLNCPAPASRHPWRSRNDQLRNSYRILFSVCVGEFRGWSLILRDPRLDVAGRNRLSGFVRILVAAVIVCVPASGIASPPIVAASTTRNWVCFA